MESSLSGFCRLLSQTRVTFGRASLCPQIQPHCTNKHLCSNCDGANDVVFNNFLNGHQKESTYDDFCLFQDGATSLFLAAQEGHVTVIRQLISSGAKVNQAREVMSSPRDFKDPIPSKSFSFLRDSFEPTATVISLFFCSLPPFVLPLSPPSHPPVCSRMVLPPCGWRLRWVIVRW